MDPVARRIVETVDLNAKLLDNVQSAIWKTPEIRFEGKKAHDLLSEELLKAGFRVTPNYILPTGFRAEHGSGGPCICFMAEYDALPEGGHACGHNLIAEAALGASLALKKATETVPGLSGRIVCLGTPAEEGGSGKELMLRGGALKDVDAVVMVHPSAVNDVAPPFMAVAKVRVRYKGRASYVVGAPACAVNALDAAVTAYTSAASMRQHMKPSWKIHGVITNGGVVASVVPDEAELYYYYRAPNAVELEQLRRLLDNCFQGAAVSTGCSLDLDWQGGYEPLLSNAPLADAFRKHAEALGLRLDDPLSGLSKVVFMASSDIGHVSHCVPTIQPTFTICSAPNHTPEFAAAAAHKDAQAPTLLMAKAMALTGLDLFRDPGLLPEVRKNFAKNRAPATAN